MNMQHTFAPDGSDPLINSVGGSTGSISKFLLAILQRGAANQERAAGQAARASARPPP